MSTTPWIKADESDADRASEDHAGVEIRRVGGIVEVRDANQPDGTVLRFTPEEWAAWIEGTKLGEFDHLLG